LKTKQRIGLIIGLIVFLIGVALGLAFNFRVVLSVIEGMSFWGNSEALSYDPWLETDAIITTVKCPILLTPTESKEIRIRVKNTKDFEIKPWVQISVSDPAQEENINRNKQELVLAPGETKEISWMLTPENIIENRIILVRFFLFRSKYHPPSITRHCGVFIPDVGNLKGSQILSLTIGLSLAFMLAGMWLWWKSSTFQMRRMPRMINRMIWLCLFWVANVIAILLEWQPASIALLILTVLLVMTIFENIMMESIFRPENPT